MPNLEEGFEIINGVLSLDEIESLNESVEGIQLNNRAGGIRNAEKKYPEINKLASSTKLSDLAKRYLVGAPALVRVIFFNKTAKNNWLVTWHQDRTVAVSKPFENKQWGPWSIKDGIHHVQPPIEVLNQMITFRVHLDSANDQNGCLKVIPRSHELGIMSHAEIQKYVKTHPPVVCSAEAGSVLAMRPHILHSSSRAANPTSRRVIHIEFSSYKLPMGVSWA